MLGPAMQVAGAAATCIAACDLPNLHTCAALLASRLTAPTSDGPAAVMLPLPPPPGPLPASQSRSSFQTPLTSPMHPAAAAPPQPPAPLVQLRVQVRVRKAMIAVLAEALPEGASPVPAPSLSEGSQEEHKSHEVSTPSEQQGQAYGSRGSCGALEAPPSGTAFVAAPGGAAMHGAPRMYSMFSTQSMLSLVLWTMMCLTVDSTSLLWPRGDRGRSWLHL